MGHILFSGLAGCGKTSSAKAVANLGDAPFFEVGAESIKTAEELAKLFNKFPGDGYDLNTGEKIGTIRPPIIFIDEAHFLTVDDYGFLLNLYNFLRDRNIQMFTVLVGEPRLLDTRTSFKASHDTQLIGRFMWSDYEFQMLNTAKDLEFVMEGYDGDGVPSEQGRGTVKSITQHFVPIAYLAGFRIATYSKQIWNAYVNTRRDIKKSRPDVMSMQSCTIMMVQLLNKLSRSDSNQLSIDEKAIDAAIDAVLYLDE